MIKYKRKKEEKGYTEERMDTIIYGIRGQSDSQIAPLQSI